MVSTVYLILRTQTKTLSRRLADFQEVGSLSPLLTRAGGAVRRSLRVGQRDLPLSRHYCGMRVSVRD